VYNCIENLTCKSLCDGICQNEQPWALDSMVPQHCRQESKMSQESDDDNHGSRSIVKFVHSIAICYGVVLSKVSNPERQAATKPLKPAFPLVLLFAPAIYAWHNRSYIENVLFCKAKEFSITQPTPLSRLPEPLKFVVSHPVCICSTSRGLTLSCLQGKSGDRESNHTTSDEAGR
jgi:hypothetical protein